MNWNDAYTDGIYKKHWDSSYPSPELVGFISTIENKKNSVILDLGCGSGEDAIFLLKYFKSVYGLDISETAISIAQKKSVERSATATFVNGDVYSMPFQMKC